MIVIHHNPGCGTSRNVLSIIEASGETPVIIDYLEEGWTRPRLLALFAAAGLTPPLHATSKWRAVAHSSHNARKNHKTSMFPKSVGGFRVRTCSNSKR